ncbi:hypothetical protein V5F49_17455 [Xanthobacter sp. V3C-3]|uniref:hypothetical protein n=1 Tax=Xanthobacter lutulentifluminis TaxID=3119935 RepID=UPI00372B53EA
MNRFRIRQRLPGLAAACLAAICVHGGAGAQEGRAYRPVAVEVGAQVTPPPELVATARRLHVAAGARDAQAVAALIAPKVAVVTSGLTPAVRRQVETLGPWPEGDAALAAIGAAFLEGDAPPAGAAGREAQGLAQALDTIAAATERPDWGRDPLLKGAYCTYRGLRWDAETAARIAEGARGLHVPAATPVHAAPVAAGAASVPPIASLKPGLIYFEGEMDDLPDGWRAVRLPSGRVGAVREADVRDTAAQGLCFLRGPDGRWQVSAFSTVLL